MVRLVEFPLGEGGGGVLVEIDDAVAGPVRAAAPGEVAPRVQQAFEAAMAGLRPIVKSIFEQIGHLGPAAATVEFGIKFTAGAGVVLAKTEAEGTLKLTLSWKAGEAPR